MDEVNHSLLQRTAKRWLIFFSCVMLLSFSLLGYRLVDLQVLQHEQLRETAQGNTIRTIVREPRRGNILDSRGNLLATSLFVKTVCVDPSLTGTFQPELARVLAPLLELDEQVLFDKLTPQLRTNSVGQSITNRYVVLKRKVPRETWEKMQGVLNEMDLGVNEEGLTRSQKLYLRQVRKSVFADKEEDQHRVYPGQRLASHILGFVGGTDHRGKEGIEYVLDSRLTGTRGWRITETDSRKREVVALRHQDVAPRNGLNAKLTLDIGVQHIVEAELDKAMEKHRPQGITAIVIRPDTGAIVAMANRPDFDPNRPGEFEAAH